MLSSSRSEGGPQILSVGVRKTIQSIKEIVRHHSDADIYVALKEANMDPNETTQKLLNQDPFHEVKRKRDKKKEVTVYKGSSNLEPRRPTGSAVPPEIRVGKIVSDHNVRRGLGYVRNTTPAVAVVSREFRVVRDNRANQNLSKEIENPNISKTEPVVSNVSENRGWHRNSNQKQVASISSKPNSRGGRKDTPEEDRRVPRYESSEMLKQLNINGESPTLMNSSNSNSNGAVLGVYSSSSDPVHVPSLDPRPSANKRQVGVVGVRRPHFPKNNITSLPSQSDQPSQTTAAATRVSETSSSAAAPAMPSIPAVRSFINNHHHNHHHSSSNRSQQQPLAHHKVSQTNKEWKPKSSQKTNVNGLGVIGAPAKSGDDGNSNKKDKSVVEELKKVPNQNVIIAPHIRVSDIDRSRLTFGTLGPHLLHAPQVDAAVQPSASVSVSTPESTSEESRNVEIIDDGGRESGSDSPASEIIVADSTVMASSSPQEMSNFADIGLVHDSNASYTPSESQQLHQHEDPAESLTFSQAYDPHSGYDMQYFRPIIDETVMRGQGLLSPQEDMSSHMVNSMPASTMAMVQQQQQQQQQVAAAVAAAQMYPQVHFTNIMPYRQYMSPVYVPQGMPMGGYSTNPAVGGAVAYSPLNGSPGYVLMPNLGGGGGGGTTPHLTAPPKYGIQHQFKTLPTPTVGIEDSSRIMKYKDSSLYIPNPQVETSEMWVNSRDMPSSQSPAYYNMTGQVSGHGAATYMPSHISHHQHHSASFGGAAVAQQSSHIQFPGGLYHSPPQQPTGNPHHMGGGGPANPLTYQQTHLPWGSTF